MCSRPTPLAVVHTVYGFLHQFVSISSQWPCQICYSFDKWLRTAVSESVKWCRRAVIKHGYTIRSFSCISCYFFHFIWPKDMSGSSCSLEYVCIIYCGQKQTPFILILTGKKLLNQALFQLSVQGLSISCQQKAWTEQGLIFQQQILWDSFWEHHHGSPNLSLNPGMKSLAFSSLCSDPSFILLFVSWG